MKIREGFVSNSSATSFMIKNESDKKKTLVDFVDDCGEGLVTAFVARYDWHNFTFEQLQESAQKRYSREPMRYSWLPGEEKEMVFGDEDGDVIGHVFDYMLRPKQFVFDEQDQTTTTRSHDWSWRFHEWRR